jgi:5-methylcytosine-specific restriction endonuclease McrA
VTPRKDAPPPRWPTRPKGAALARIRVAVYRAAAFKCVHCGWQPRPPEGGWEAYDGTYALSELIPRVPTPRRLTPYTVRYLTLGHVVRPEDGGPFTAANLRAECTPCNNAQKGGS